MKSTNLKLRTLQPEDEISFMNAIAEFKNEMTNFEFAFNFHESIPFNRYIKEIEGWSQGKGLPDKFVPSTFFIGVVDRQIVGRLSLRHYLTDYLERIGGHIGCGVIPSCRQRGYATEMLKQALPICSSLGIERVLITCDVDNDGSRRVIERCGGVFESVTDDSQLKVQKRRYWIDSQ